MSRIVVVAAGRGELARLVAAVREVLHVSLVELRHRAQTGSALVDFVLFGNDHDEVAGKLRRLIAALERAGVGFRLYELGEDESFSEAAQPERFEVSPRVVENILRKHEAELERQRGLGEKFMETNPKNLTSPNGRHAIVLEPTGEECLGRPLYRLRLNGAVLESRRSIGRWVFGGEVVWSADSRYLAAQRWDLPDRGPQTSIVVVDLDENLWRIVGPGYCAVMRPVAFDEAVLNFETLDVRTAESAPGRTDCAASLVRWDDLQDLMLSGGR